VIGGPLLKLGGADDQLELLNDFVLAHELGQRLRPKPLIKFRVPLDFH
jgi:hypothetical protein